MMKLRHKIFIGIGVTSFILLFILFFIVYLNLPGVVQEPEQETIRTTDTVKKIETREQPNENQQTKPLQYNFTGQGTTVTEKFFLRKGSLIAETTYYGRYHMATVLYTEDGDIEAVLANLMDSQTQSKITKINSEGMYRLQIENSQPGRWKVTLKQE